MSKERVQIYVDGGNFHHLVLKRMGVQEVGFDFEAFADLLVRDRELVTGGKRYYVGTVREKDGDEKSKEAMSTQTMFLNILQSYDWQLKTSKLVTRMESVRIDSRVVEHERLTKLGIRRIDFERTREKGIDVKLAVDLIVGAIDDKYDTAIVVSSDSDLIPAMDWVRMRMKKRIEYIGFSMPHPTDPQKSVRPLTSLIHRSDIQRTLAEPDLKVFVRPFTGKKRG